MLLPLLLFNAHCETGSPLEHMFTYFKQTDEATRFGMDVNDHSFDEIWYFTTSKATKSSDNKTVTLQPQTSQNQGGTIIRQLKVLPTETLWTHLELQCLAPYSQSKMEQASCVISYDQETRDGIKIWRKEIPLGKTITFRLERLINATSYIGLYLTNAHSTKSFVFSPPKMTFLSFPSHIVETTESKERNARKVTAHIKAVNEVISLNSMLLNDSFFLNDYIGPSDLSPIPIIANKSFIIGIDILDQRFIHPWKCNINSFLMNICPKEEFTLSLYYIQRESENYLDALDYWYSLFPEIYYEQKHGIGTLVAFMDLDRNNYTGLQTDFMAKYFWCGWTQEGLMNFYYI